MHTCSPLGSGALPQSSSRPCIWSHDKPQYMPAQWIQVCIMIEVAMVISETICVHQFVKYYQWQQ